VADVWSLGVAYIVAGVVYAIRLPFVLAIRRMGLDADRVKRVETVGVIDDLPSSLP
jgi:hypothetical protein